MGQFSKNVAWLNTSDHVSLLRHCLHGIERECLRVTPQGMLALTPHPSVLGSALTNPYITTDYSESLLEFITPALSGTVDVLAHLANTHCFVSQSLSQELLWSSSMPCPLPDEDSIPIAYFGESLSGQFKHIYRKGLAVRYGKAMQCIAGIHYNFSLPEAFWAAMQQYEEVDTPLTAYQSNRYIGIIRNFRRYAWLLMYLFGSSPVLDASFLAHYPNYHLEKLDQDSYYLPWATSLRMSDLGYQSNAQASLTPCYNELNSYIDSLSHAILTPYSAYEKIGTKKGSEWLQLSTHVLQIENEYYSDIRPKRVVKEGQRPIEALKEQGVQYIEVRCMDIDPFLPMGIDTSTSYFLNSFLLYCALEESPLLVDGECGRCRANFLTTVKEGRKPHVKLKQGAEEVLLYDWANQLLENITLCAQLLDSSLSTTVHVQAVEAQQAKMSNSDLLPSAKVLASMQNKRMSFAEFSLSQSRAHASFFKAGILPEDIYSQYQSSAVESLHAQHLLEQQQLGTLNDYIRRYTVCIK